MSIRNTLALAGAASLALVMGGCGGGGDGASAAAAATPAAAQPAGVAAALAYIAQQKTVPSDDVDPRTLQQALPAADDTTEPGSV